MKIVVIGGTGLIGSKLVGKLKQAGHEAVPASPASGVNTVTGEGLDKAFEGADVVVDVANSPTFEDKAALDFFTAAGRNIFAAEKAAGVRYHVALSVVGTERLLEMGYFHAKLVQEDLIKTSGVPYTLVRATQFYEFVPAIAQSATEGDTVRLSPAFFQPMAADDVAAALAKVTLEKPVNGMIEIGGPKAVRLSDLVKSYLAATNDPRHVVVDTQARYFGILLNDSTLVPGDDARLGAIEFEQWLKSAKAAA